MVQEPTTGQQVITAYQDKLAEILENETAEPIQAHKSLLERLAVVTTIGEMTSAKSSSSDRLAAARLALEMTGRLGRGSTDAAPQVVLNFGSQVGDALAGIGKLSELRYRHVKPSEEDPDA